ncbi:MAG: thiol protease/hemagglutinin PrtT [Flavobacteriales bacterium]|nr:thiol protease/hemagglutinin PrtT [Flavobacteriales bacterium]
MKKSLKALFLLALLSINLVHASNVPTSDVLKISENYYANVSPTRNTSFVGNIALTIFEKQSRSNNSPLFHVVNVNNDGFVVVAADNEVKPILGYSTNGQFDPNNIPVQLQDLINSWQEGIEREIKDAIPASTYTSNLWTQALQGSFSGSRSGSVAPLTTTTWNQWPRYNKFCPGGAPTGCVATAVAQIMKYHNHPPQGSGSHSYTHPDYGTLSANFGATSYDWSVMPNKLTSSSSQNEIDEVAKVNYHIGVSLDMDYGPNGSATYSYKVRNALKDHFNYKNSVSLKYRYSYSLSSWKNMLKNELDNNRVVYHSGFCPDPAAGHAFVIDGYDTNDMFHVNWGWGGSYNGYFEINNLNPGSTYTWNQSQKAIIGIEPIQMTLDLKLADETLYHRDTTYNDTTLVWDTVLLQFDTVLNPITEHLDTFSFDTSIVDTLGLVQDFSLTTTIGNWGNIFYNGRFMAAICDLNNVIIDTVEISDTVGISAYDYMTIVFESKAKSLMPGDYKFSIFWDDNGSWQLIDQDYYYNGIHFYNNGGQTEPEGILSFGSISINPDPIYADTAFQVEIIVKNNQNTSWTGLVSADFHELNGDWLDEIGHVSRTYQPYEIDTIVFNAPATDLDLGGYLIGIWNQEQGSNWEMVKEGYFKNNREVQIVEKEFALVPDSYEDNNSPQNAYDFYTTSLFNNNAALIYTNSTNIHNELDQDYFRVNFEAGYTYEITPILFDASAPNAPKDYTLEAVFSYGVNTNPTLQYYDNEEVGSISIDGDGFVSFHVQPYFQNAMGTYNLQFQITRTPNFTNDLSAVNSSESVNIYPNPNNGQFTIANISQWNSASIFDANGKLVYTFANLKNELIEVNLSDKLNKGIYSIRLESEDKVYNERFIIK